MLDGFFLRDILEDALFASIEGDALSSGSHVAVIGVRHLTGTVDDTAHDGNLETFILRGCFLHFRNGFLEIEERTSATRAGDILRLINTHARGLQDILAQEIEFRLREIRIDQRQYRCLELPKQTSALRCGLQAERVPVVDSSSAK